MEVAIATKCISENLLFYFIKTCCNNKQSSIMYQIHIVATFQKILVFDTKGQLQWVKTCTLSMIFLPQFSIHECLDSLLAGRALEIFDGTWQICIHTKQNSGDEYHFWMNPTRIIPLLYLWLKQFLYFLTRAEDEHIFYYIAKIHFSEAKGYWNHDTGLKTRTGLDIRLESVTLDINLICVKNHFQKRSKQL